MAAEKIQPVRRSPLWMRVVLAISLAFNLAVVGLAAGAALRMIGPGGPPVPPGSLGGAMYRAMPPEDRHALLHDVRESLAPLRNRRADAARLAAALRADPYDSAATRAVLEEQAATRAGWQSALQDAWLARVTAMSPEARKAYAGRLEHDVRSHDNKHRPDRKPADGD